jgi:hypothetical protein
MISTLHIYLLGDFLLLSGEAPVTSVDLPRLQSALAYLLLHRNPAGARSPGLPALARLDGCPGAHQSAQPGA